MFCSNCGGQAPDGAKVCPSCGTPIAGGAPKAAVASSAQEVKTQAAEFVGGSVNSAAEAVKTRDFKSLLKNKLVIAAAALIVVVALVVVFLIVLGSSSSAPFAIASNQIDWFYTEDYTTVLFYNGKQIKTELDSTNVSIYSNNDKSSVYVSADGTLYALSGEKLNEVNDDCSVLTVAGFGSSIFYISDDTLYVSDGGKPTRISDLERTPNSYSASPDGSAFAWTVYEDDEYVGYAWTGSKVTDLGEMNRVLSITNGGDLIYCETDSGKLGYIKGMSDEIESVKSLSGVAALSADNRQIMFVSSSSTFVFAPSMEEPVKVDKGSVSILLPESGYYTSNNFDNFVGISSSTIKRYTRKGDEYPDNIKLASNCYTALISADGKNILYYTNNKMVKRDTVTEDGDKITVAKDVYDFAADANFNNIYYINGDYELVYSNGKENGMTTVYDNDNVSGMALSTSGACAFIYDRSGGEGSVAYSANGGDKQKCSGVSALDTFSTGTLSAQKYIYAVNADDELYISTDGKSFTNTKVVLY